MDELVQAMGMSGISKSSVSKLCKEIDERVAELATPQLEELTAPQSTPHAA